jgi:protein-S-isoprenylcysteine O-methyltransferase Ste14
MSIAIPATRSHPRLVAAGRACFGRRGLMLPAAGLLLAIPSPPLAEDPALPGALGLLLALVGQVIRSVTVGLAYIIRGGKDHRVYAENLVTDGFYAHCRNPMYFANLFLLAGLALAANRAAFALCAVPLGLALHWLIVLAEEDFLRDKFGAAYEDYCRRVPRWVPRMTGLAATVRRVRFDWRRMLALEYQKSVDWICAIVVIVLFNLWRVSALDENPALVAVLIAVLCVRLAAWLAARALRGQGTTAPG